MPPTPFHIHLVLLPKASSVHRHFRDRCRQVARLPSEYSHAPECRSPETDLDGEALSDPPGQFELHLHSEDRSNGELAFSLFGNSPVLLLNSLLLCQTTLRVRQMLSDPIPIVSNRYWSDDREDYLGNAASLRRLRVIGC